MSIARWGMGVALATFVGSVAFADEVSNMKSELADLKAKVAAMESAQMAPAAGGDAESLTSMKKKGAIKIGGEVQVAMEVIDREDQAVQVGAPVNGKQGDNDDVLSTVFTTAEANLDFQVNASKDVFLFLRLDLDDFWTDDQQGIGGGAVKQDDLLEEVYFMWKNVRGMPWDVWFGKKEAPFGMNKDPLILEQVTNRKDGKQSSYLGQQWEAEDAANFAGGANPPLVDTNPHNVLGDYAHPGAFDNVFQVGTSWKWKELVKAEFAVFQSKADNLSTGGGQMTRGMHEDRSDDTMFFQSMTGRLTVTPIENLSIVLSALTEHNDSAGDGDLLNGTITAATPARMFGAEADADGDNEDADDSREAVSLGVDYKFKPIPLELWTEYLYGWNWAWNDEYDADVLVVGAKYGLTEAIDLYLIGDWVGIDDERVEANDQDEDYYRLAAAVQYTFDNGITLSLEYAHEWYDLEEEVGTGNGALLRNEGAEADVVIFGTAWKF